MNGTKSITNDDDVIDSRDVIERIDELEAHGDELDVQARAEYEALTALRDEAVGYAEDWQYGIVLIRDSYFTDYAQDLADDIGAIDRNAAWPLGCIDWNQAAAELQMDYTAVTFDGVTYWVR